MYSRLKTHMLVDPEHPFRYTKGVCGHLGRRMVFTWSNVTCKRCLKKKPRKRR